MLKQNYPYCITQLDADVYTLDEGRVFTKLILPSDAKILAEHLNTFATLYTDEEIENYNSNCCKEFTNEINNFKRTGKDRDIKTKRFVYLFKSDTNKYKIGLSSNPQFRVKAFDNPSNKVEIVCTSNPIYNAYKHEHFLHEKYFKYNIGNEWFDFKDDTTVINNVKQDILNLV